MSEANHLSDPLCLEPIHWDMNGKAWRCKSWQNMNGHHQHLRVRDRDSDIPSEYLNWEDEILEAADTGYREVLRYGILIGIFFGIVLSLSLLKIGGQL